MAPLGVLSMMTCKSVSPTGQSCIRFWPSAPQDHTEHVAEDGQQWSTGPEHQIAGTKYDKDKPLYDLLPPYAIAAVADVLTHGAKKYAPENWRKVKGWRWRYLGAALRHVFAYMQGHKIDPESGCLHLAHAACCLCFMLELDAVGDTHGDGRA